MKKGIVKTAGRVSGNDSPDNATQDAASSQGNKILGVGIRMEMYEGKDGGRILYFEFRRDINCRRLFFWKRLREVLIERSFDIKGGFSDEEWGAFPFNPYAIPGSVLAANKSYPADGLDGIKIDVQAMFNLWTDADIRDIACQGQESTPQDAGHETETAQFAWCA
ncbi:MAG: hypothetical protein C0404_06965 [Verrucomicrobia bacterium]|nr:hypothetical protein [Verrucomicrobiota bacterium]